MHTLIVFAHPASSSFTHKVLNRFIEGLVQAGHTHELSDLYSIRFQSDMSEDEYLREGMLNSHLPLAPDVQAEHKKIARAHCIAFVYPVWWSDCPAKMKGWFDRVYSLGYAYGYSDDSPLRMKTIAKGIVICTAGHPVSFLEETGIAKSMRNVMIDDRLGKRFVTKEFHILGGMTSPEIYSDDNLRRAFEIGACAG